jgi:hypothetical protein
VKRPVWVICSSIQAELVGEPSCDGGLRPRPRGLSTSGMYHSLQKPALARASSLKGGCGPTRATVRNQGTETVLWSGKTHTHQRAVGRAVVHCMEVSEPVIGASRREIDNMRLSALLQRGLNTPGGALQERAAPCLRYAHTP